MFLKHITFKIFPLSWINSVLYFTGRFVSSWHLVDRLKFFSHQPIYTRASQEPGNAEIAYFGQNKEDIERAYNTTTTVFSITYWRFLAGKTSRAVQTLDRLTHDQLPLRIHLATGFWYPLSLILCHLNTKRNINSGIRNQNGILRKDQGPLEIKYCNSIHRY